MIDKNMSIRYFVFYLGLDLGYLYALDESPTSTQTTFILTQSVKLGRRSQPFSAQTHCMCTVDAAELSSLARFEIVTETIG